MKKLQKYYALFEDIISGLFLFSGLGLMFYEVIMRYVFNSPTTWINEISTILVIWGILLGLSMALRDDHHISVDLLYEVVPLPIKKGIDIFANAMGALFCLFFAYNGWQLVHRMYETQQASVVTRIPLWMFYSVLPVSGILFFIRFVERLYRVISSSSGYYDQKSGEEIHEHSSVV